MFVVINKKIMLSILVVVVIFIACFSLLFYPNIMTVINNNPIKKIPVYQVDKNEKVVSLTFDAAWGSDKTQGILEILKEENIMATFFLVGFWIDKNEALVKEIEKSGCDIGNHSVNHYDMTNLSANDFELEINTVNEKIEKLTGKKPKFFRFPFGAYNSQCVQKIEKLDMIPIQWNVDSLDWKGIGAEEILNRVNKGVKNGSIILFHNNSDYVLEALPIVIKSLINKGYKIVPLRELVYLENYYVDNNGVQHQN